MGIAMALPNEGREIVAAPPRRRMLRRELYWFLVTFGIPFLVLHAFDLLPQHGDAPWWKRFLLMEDACAYGVCLLVPFLTYVVCRVVGALAGK